MRHARAFPERRHVYPRARSGRPLPVAARAASTTPSTRRRSRSSSTRCAQDSYETFKEFSARRQRRRRERCARCAACFDFKHGGEPVPLDEVEPATEIVKRFSTGAMSLRLDLARRPTRRSPSR